jgi:hypothetical protein
MDQFTIKTVETTRRTKSGSRICAIIQMPEGFAAEQLPSEVAKELTGDARAFAIVDRNSKSAPKGDMTADLSAIVAAAVAKALADLKK